MFAITYGKGFHIALANGWTISVQFGPGNYCEHYGSSSMREFCERPAPRRHESRDAEIAIWKGNGEMIDLNGDTVAARVSPDKVAEILAAMLTEPDAHVATAISRILE